MWVNSTWMIGTSLDPKNWCKSKGFWEQAKFSPKKEFPKFPTWWLNFWTILKKIHPIIIGIHISTILLFPRNRPYFQPALTDGKPHSWFQRNKLIIQRRPGFWIWWQFLKDSEDLLVVFFRGSCFCWWYTHRTPIWCADLDPFLWAKNVSHWARQTGSNPKMMDFSFLSGDYCTSPETKILHLKHWGWKMSFLLGRPTARCELLVVGSVVHDDLLPPHERPFVPRSWGFFSTQKLSWGEGIP